MKLIVFLLIAASCYSTVIPPDPKACNKPDSLFYYSGNQLQSKISLTYNSDGYLTQMTDTILSRRCIYYTSKYTKSGDTVKCINSYFDGSEDTQMYIFDKSNKIIKCNSYEDNKITEIDSFVYKEDKIVKTIITNPDPDIDGGDSIVYKYDQNGNLKSETQYGNSGKIWEYTEYETDASGRVGKAYEFKCDAGCIKTGGEMIYHYTGVRNNRRYTAISPSASFTINVSTNNLNVVLQNGSQMKSLGIYDLKGNKVTSVATGNLSSGSIELRNITTQFYLVRVETKNGLILRKIFISSR